MTALVERARLQREHMCTDVLRTVLHSSVSHDLQILLTSIKASASALLQEDPARKKGERQCIVRTIGREADCINRLVSNLQGMSRIEESVLKPEKEGDSLGAMICAVLARLVSLLGWCEVCLCLPPDDLLLVEGDYLQVAQVLANLLEHAIHSTPQGSPIAVSAHSDGQQVVCCVVDRRPGPLSSDLTRVCNALYQVLSPDQPMESGLGLAWLQAANRSVQRMHAGVIAAGLLLLYYPEQSGKESWYEQERSRASRR